MSFAGPEVRYLHALHLKVRSFPGIDRHATLLVDMIYIYTYIIYIVHFHACPNYSKAQVLALPLVLDSGSGLKNCSDGRADLTSTACTARK